MPPTALPLCPPAGNYSVSKSLSDLAPPRTVASVAQIGTESGVYSKNVTGE